MVLKFLRGQDRERLDRIEEKIQIMFRHDRHEFDLAMSALMGHVVASDVNDELRSTDQKVNRLEREIRRDLIVHFSKHRLRNEDFEFPDLLGAAYEYLIRDFADSAGKKGGEFYTPRSVVRMMVRLVDPREGMRVYDPCSGSGGMLIYARSHVAESGGNPNARNPSGAWGCYQIMPGTWRSSCSDLGQHGSASTDAQAQCASRLPSSSWAATGG
jgi:type I restriction-modification system DNA methylase subunit